MLTLADVDDLIFISDLCMIVRYFAHFNVVFQLLSYLSLFVRDTLKPIYVKTNTKLSLCLNLMPLHPQCTS